MDTLHEDLHAFLNAEVTRWGIHTQTGTRTTTCGSPWENSPCRFLRPARRPAPQRSLTTGQLAQFTKVKAPRKTFCPHNGHWPQKISSIPKCKSSCFDGTNHFPLLLTLLIRQHSQIKNVDSKGRRTLHRTETKRTSKNTSPSYFLNFFATENSVQIREVLFEKIL
jgi:hypothetical protein